MPGSMSSRSACCLYHAAGLRLRLFTSDSCLMSNAGIDAYASHPSKALLPLADSSAACCRLAQAVQDKDTSEVGDVAEHLAQRHICSDEAQSARPVHKLPNLHRAERP